MLNKEYEIKIAALTRELAVVTESNEKAQKGLNLFMAKYENSERTGITKGETFA